MSEASVPAESSRVHDRIEVSDVRDVLAALGAPIHVGAVMPELRYVWECGCRVIVDSDALERRWERCPAHHGLEARRRRIA